MFFFVGVCSYEWDCYKVLSHWWADVCCGLCQLSQITVIINAVLRCCVQHCRTESLTHNSTGLHFNLRVSLRYSFHEKGLPSGQMQAVISQKEYTDIHTRPILSVVSMLARASGSVSSFWYSCSCKMWIAVQTLHTTSKHPWWPVTSRRDHNDVAWMIH